MMHKKKTAAKLRLILPCIVLGLLCTIVYLYADYSGIVMLEYALIFALVFVSGVCFCKLVLRKDSFGEIYNQIRLPFMIITKNNFIISDEFRRLIGIDKKASVKDVCELLNNEQLTDNIKNRKNFKIEFKDINGKQLIFEGCRLFKKSKCIGFAVTAYDVSVVSELGSQIAEKNEQIENLKFANHDFKNKMHVLLGYMETEQWEVAKDFINGIRNDVPTDEIGQITRLIANRAIASLLIGKVTKAKELGIQINILPDCSCDTLSDGIPEDDYITVIGNLIENSIEELEKRKDRERYIDLFINTNNEWTLISVMDNGDGMTEEDAERIFDKGFTTKEGNNHGLGLSAVRMICDKFDGSVDVETEPGEGFAVNVVIHGE